MRAVSTTDTRSNFISTHSNHKDKEGYLALVRLWVDEDTVCRKRVFVVDDQTSNLTFRAMFCTIVLHVFRFLIFDFLR